jgi:hypothetical protein
MPLANKKLAPRCLFADKHGRHGVRLAVTLATIFLAACSSEGSGSDFGQIFQYSRGAFDHPSSDVTLDQAKAVPYASLGVKIGDGPQAMLVLADGTGPELSWTSASHVSLITRDGRIIGSAGFEHNLSGFQSRTAGDPISPADALQGPISEKLMVDLSDLRLYSLPVSCVASVNGTEEISILGTSIHTVHVQENCEAQKANWNFTNNYWIDPETHLVWRSQQTIHPRLEPITIDILRPPENRG